METFSNGIPRPYPGMLMKYGGRAPVVISSVSSGSVLGYRLKGRPKIESLCSTESQWCILWAIRKGRIIQESDLTPQSKMNLDEIKGRVVKFD